MILKTLKEVRYNKSKAARILNIDRKTLYLKIEKYGIE
jgi:two-component system response regulator HydG